MSRLDRIRGRLPFLDHLIRALGRYMGNAGDRLAAAVTYYWFLSLFPILLLAVSIFGFVYGERSTQVVNDALAGILPRNLTSTIGSTLQQTRAPAGVIGLVGLLITGTGWIDALRESIRSMWHYPELAANIVVRKLLDVVVLVGLFATVATSLIITGLVTAAQNMVLRDRPGASLVAGVVGIVLSLFADTLLFLYLFGRLSRVSTPWRRLLPGAVFGAVAFELLKRLGAFYVESTATRNAATYGTFAVVVGLLVFLNLASRLLLFTAAWIVTAPYDSDVAPSASAGATSAHAGPAPPNSASVAGPVGAGGA